MTRALPIFVIACCWSSSAWTAPFSVKCMDDQLGRPYYLTLDPEKKAAHFRSAMGTPIWGSITSSEGGRISIVLPRGNNPPDYDLVWEQASLTLTWIGVPNDPTRRMVESRCELSEPPDK